MRRIAAFLILALGYAITAALLFGAQTANYKKCTMDDVNRALDEVDRLKDWDAVYAFFKAFHHCDSGAVAEGVSDSVVQLLAKDWNHFDAFARLAASDEAFKKFVLRHIDETALSEELEAATRNAVTLCLAGQTQLCELIEAQIRRLDLIVGMLEDLPGRYVKEPNFRAVRVLFRKSGDDWEPFRSDCRDMACLKSLPSEYPSEVTWTIAFDGKNVGQITTRRPSEFKYYADEGLEEITGAEPVPAVGKQS